MKITKLNKIFGVRRSLDGTIEPLTEKQELIAIISFYMIGVGVGILGGAILWA